MLTWATRWTAEAWTLTALRAVVARTAGRAETCIVLLC